MGIRFSDGTMPVFQRYTGGRAWDDYNLLGNVHHSWRQFNTEPTLRAALEAINPTAVAVMELDYRGMLNSSQVNMYVVKGLHQGRQINNRWTTHCTIAYSAYLWHLDFALDRWGRLVFVGLSKGVRYQQDGDGFQVVGNKRGNRRR